MKYKPQGPLKLDPFLSLIYGLKLSGFIDLVKLAKIHPIIYFLTQA